LLLIISCILSDQEQKIKKVCILFKKYPGNERVFIGRRVLVVFREKILHFSIQLHSAAAVSVTPSLPEGEAAQGEHPLDPHYFQEYIPQPSPETIAIGGCPNSGGGSTMCWSLQEQLFDTLRISTKPKILGEGENKSAGSQKFNDRLSKRYIIN
jgi:hypothetical protein